jgi:ribonuclease-3
LFGLKTRKPSKHKSFERQINYRFKNYDRFKIAFTHRSVKSASSKNYERLEFLGDAVIDLVVSRFVMHEFPEGDEGLLTKKRSALVQQSFLASMGEMLGLLNHLTIDPTVNINHKKVASKQQANLFEALIGAIYLDGGLDPCRKLISSTIWAHRQEAWKVINYKGQLIEYCHSNGHSSPVFHVVNITGPEHEKLYEVHVSIGDKTYPPGFESNKKSAEQAAAEQALAVLNY